MSVILGSGDHRYRVIEQWAKLPPELALNADVGGVGVDSKDQVYVFNRGPHPMLVFDREGNFLRSWGEGLFPRAHGVYIDADDNLYLTNSDSVVIAMKRSDGAVLWEQDAMKRRGLSAPALDGDALVVGDFEGYVHWLDKATGEILGVHIIGPEATEIIHEFALGRTLEATLEEIIHTIHAHPTLSEAALEATLAALGQAIHI